ncbi:hypothetical protein KIPB_006545 [Kipferlia bialata]|uniref:4Fe-4S dicluster domain-containing protein n=1 Tax=Kipferlia bialata TaxID=797122 RepID=A0A9K3CZ44_9EUKA|nr:hypothetical protein KIPB_006545 [Kipferlia bialata]|eukprot:g6545.t1
MQSQLLLSGPIDELAPMVSTDSEMVTLTINNQEVSVPASFSILDACRKFGFFVPTVCHHPRMKPLGRCKVCVVEMEDTGNLAMSCSTRVENGMKVRTDTPRVRTKAAECLRDLKERQKSRAMPKLNVDKSEFDNVMEWADSAEMENNGSIFIDPTQCVECGRCATACTSLQDMNILELPPKSAVKPIGGIHLRDTPCIACGQCASFCPTNAISEVGTVPKYPNSIFPAAGLDTGDSPSPSSTGSSIAASLPRIPIRLGTTSSRFLDVSIEAAVYYNMILCYVQLGQICSAAACTVVLGGLSSALYQEALRYLEDYAIITENGYL